LFKGDFLDRLPRLPDGRRSGLPPVEISRMLVAAQACNARRNIDYMLLSTQMMLGLGPPLTPYVTRTFFTSRYTFYVSSLLLISAALLLLRQRRHGLLIVMTMSAAIYVSMVFIVALKQGGEDRYTDTVEPMFVLSVAIAAAVLGAKLIDLLARNASGRWKQVFRWLPSA